MGRSAGAAGFCVTAAVAAMVTAGFSWPAVLLGWCGATAILLALPRRGAGRPGPAALPGNLGILAATTLGAERAFPEDGTFPFVSLMLLAILGRALLGERKSPRRVAAVLGLILGPVLALVLLFGMGQVRWTENIPGGFSWGQVYVAGAAACPWWCLGREKGDQRFWGWYAAGVGVSLGLSLLTHGVLGDALAQTEEFPLYRAVQAVRVLGVLQRLEALVAAVVLMGAFGILLLAGELARPALEMMPGPRRLKIFCLLAAVFALEWAARSLSPEAAAVLRPAFWVFLPLFALGIVFLTKFEKRA